MDKPSKCRNSDILRGEKTKGYRIEICPKAKNRLSAIIRSNRETRSEPEPGDAVDDLTSKVSRRRHSSRKDIQPKSEEDYDNTNMKFNKTSPRVSDSHPPGPSGVRKSRTLKRDNWKRREAASDVLNIPLPPGDVRPVCKETHKCGTGDQEPSSSKQLFSRKSPEQFKDEMTTFQTREDLPVNYQITVTSENLTSDPVNTLGMVLNSDISDLKTSPVSSCEPDEFIHDSKSRQEFIQDYPANKRAISDTDYTNSTKEDCVSSRFPTVIKRESKYSSPSSETQAYSTVEHEFCEERKTLSNRKVLDLHHEGKEMGPVQLPDMSFPPPTFQIPYGTPITSKHHTPGKERPSSWYSARSSPMSYDSISRHSLSGSPNLDDRGSLYQIPMRRRLDSERNRRYSRDISPQSSESGGMNSPLCHRLHNRSYESHLQETRYRHTMTRASSSDSVSTDSERSFQYHLSQQVVQQTFQERNYGELGSSGRGNERNRSLVSPYYNHFSPSLLPQQEADDPLEPNLQGHQLLGDSQLLRFSKQLLGKIYRSSGNMNYLGLCVSGQTIQDLLHKIKKKFYPVGDKIVLMIGTNNFLRHHSLDDMTTAWDELISLLLSNPSRKIVLLTVPPIPRLDGDESHKLKLKKFNMFIKGYAFGSDVQVADISPLFLTDDLKCRLDLFESSYVNRPDFIHLNTDGFQTVRDFLIKKNYL